MKRTGQKEIGNPLAASSPHDPAARRAGGPQSAPRQLVTFESQREYDFFTGEWSELRFVKLYVAARESGLLAEISDRDWKTLCALSTYMNSEGYCFPSQGELARALGCSRQTANERIQSLAQFRFRGQPVLLVINGNRSESGTWAHNGYQVLPLAALIVGKLDKPEVAPAHEESLPAAAVTPSVRARKPVSGNPDTAGRSVSPFADTVGKSVSANPDTVAFRPVSANPDTALSTVSAKVDTARFRRQIKGNSKSVPFFEGTVSESVSAGADSEHADTNESHELNKIERRIENSNFRIPPASEFQQNPAQRRSRGSTSSRDVKASGCVDIEERTVLHQYLSDFAREFHDQAPPQSSQTRLWNIYRQSGLEIDGFIQQLYAARLVTKQRSVGIKLGEGPTKNKMAYFFAVLEDRLGLRNE